MSGATVALVCVLFTVGKRGAVPEERKVDDEAQMRALADWRTVARARPSLRSAGKGSIRSRMRSAPRCAGITRTIWRGS